MDFYRIQDKMVSREKLMATVTRILELRSRGLSQQETADRLKVDRTFISRLETLGELRKGQTIAVIGFPILNKAEIQELAENEELIICSCSRKRSAMTGSPAKPEANC